ncbi:MAG: c-type cytochrome [Planctomycetota bacterium]
MSTLLASIYGLVDSVDAGRVLLGSSGGGGFDAAKKFWDVFWFGDRPFTDAARQADWMFMFIWWSSVAFFLLLMALMVLFAIRYRRRKGVAAPVSASHNTILEITWTVIPTLFFLFMFFEGFRGYVNLNYAPAGAIECNLTGFRWSWKLEYPNGQISNETATVTRGARASENEQAFASLEAPVWYFPEGEPVLLRMTSTDVIHSFWVPDFRTKMDLFPNRYTSYTFTPDMLDDTAVTMSPQDDELGPYPYRDHVMHCAEFCGDSHSEMAAIIRIVPREIYDAKLEVFGSPRGTLAERGQLVSQQQGCFSCHSVDGSTGTGPTWLNLYNTENQYADGSMVLADDNHLRESILVPGAKIRAGYANQMVPYDGILTSEQIGWIIAYMKTLSTSTPQAELDAAQVDPDAEGEAAEGEQADGQAGAAGDGTGMMEPGDG